MGHPRKLDAREIARGIAAERTADILFVNGEVSEQSYGAIIFETIPHKRYDHVLVILVTFGGDANSAYRIARFFQNRYKKVSIYVPSYCKSAGTFLVTGSNELIIGDFGELGPLDVQLYKSDELGEIRSGLIIRSAFASLNEHAFSLFENFMLNINRRSQGLVKLRTSADIATAVTIGLMSSVYAQINPINAGEDYRDLQVAFEYGLRLSQYVDNATPEGVYALAHGYPSHEFVIDREEAHSLFKNVLEPSEDLLLLTMALGERAIKPNVSQVRVEMLSAPEPVGDAAEEGGDDERDQEERSEPKSSEATSQ